MGVIMAGLQATLIVVGLFVCGGIGSWAGDRKNASREGFWLGLLNIRASRKPCDVPAEGRAGGLHDCLAVGRRSSRLRRFFRGAEEERGTVKRTTRKASSSRGETGKAGGTGGRSAMGIVQPGDDPPSLPNERPSPNEGGWTEEGGKRGQSNRRGLGRRGVVARNRVIPQGEHGAGSLLQLQQHLGALKRSPRPSAPAGLGDRLRFVIFCGGVLMAHQGSGGVSLTGPERPQCHWRQHQVQK